MGLRELANLQSSTPTFKMNFDGQDSYKPIYSHTPYILGIKCYNTSTSTFSPVPPMFHSQELILASNSTKSYGGEDEDFCNDLDKEVASWEEETAKVRGLVDQLKKVGTSLRMELTCPLTRSEEPLDWMANWVKRCLMDGNGDNQNNLMVCFDPDMFTDYQEFYLEGVYQFMRRLMEKIRGEWNSKIATSLLFCNYLLKNVFWRGDFLSYQRGW